jgi:ectoine hydroxylase-related dioxygenase (phytanoyl-CoA dioxygenase family)
VKPEGYGDRVPESRSSDPRVMADVFRETGVVKVPGAFAGDAPRLGELVRRHVQRRFGIVEADPSTWARRCDRAISVRRFRHPEHFHAVVAPEVRATLDEIFGAGAWTDASPRARVLVTPPRRHAEWLVPTGFHFDVPLDRPAWPGHGVLLFSFLAEVGPEGGGTCVVSGTHRLVDPFLAEYGNLPVERRRSSFLRQQGEWLRQLVNEDDRDPDRSQRCLTGAVVEGVPLRVMELTGAPGDVVITHDYTLHASSPNTSSNVRLMLSTAIGSQP